MTINSSVSFKGYVPVVFYAKNPSNDKYVPVLKNENLRKCQSFVVRNLNSTAKNNKDDGFVRFYADNDPDYVSRNEVHSVYRQKGPMLYMVSGSDVDKVREFAKPVGIAKADSIEALGHTKSFEVREAAHNYINSVYSFLKNTCKQLRTKDGSEKLVLCLFFDPKYKKRTGKLSGFEFSSAKFVTQDSKEIIDEYCTKNTLF